MPLYVVHRQNDVSGFDDSPILGNSPPAESASHTRVVECGNRVLELIEKHKQEIQSRMTNRGNTFRGMLERELENRNKRLERGHRSEHSTLEDALSKPYNQTSSPKQKFSKDSGSSRSAPATPTAARKSSQRKSSLQQEPRVPSVGLISSDEYLQPPEPATAQTVLKRGSESPRNSYNWMLSSPSKREKEILRKRSNNFARSTPRKSSSHDSDDSEKLLDNNRRSVSSEFSFPFPNSTEQSYCTKDGTEEECIYEPQEEEDGRSTTSEDNYANNNRVSFKSRVQFNYPSDSRIPNSGTNNQEQLGYCESTGGNLDSMDEDEENACPNDIDEESGPPMDNYNRRQPENVYLTDSNEDNRGQGTDSEIGSRSSTTASNLSRSRSSSEEVTMSIWASILAMLRGRAWEFCVLVAVIAIILGICVMSMDYSTNSKIIDVEEKKQPKLFKYTGPVM